MNIGILASGGDGVGMNNCLYHLCKDLYKQNNIILFDAGFKGLVYNKTCKFDIDELKQNSLCGGVVIHSSRCPEFATIEGIQKAVKTYDNHKLDVLIVMGGNGSLRGVKEFFEHKKNVMFVPCSIDNDVFDSDYAIGFSTACKNCIEYIQNVNCTMQAFNRACIYEVMGRDCGRIADFVSIQVDADYCYSNEKCSIDDCAKSLQTKSPIIVLKENLVNIEDFAKELQEKTKIETRYCVIGYYQRGGKPTKLEVKNSKLLANACTKCIKQNLLNKQVLLKITLKGYKPYIKAIEE